MLSYSTILVAFIPVFLIVIAGVLMQRRGWIGGEAVETGVMRLGLNLLIPCFILNVIPGNPALKTGSSVGWAMGLGFGIIIIGFGMAWLVARIAGIRKGEGARTFTISTAVQNYGYLPLPIVAELFAKDKAESLQGLILVHGLGVELAMWTVGIWILTGKAQWKSILNGPFITTVVALILNYTGLFEYIPKFVNNFTGMLGVCAIPMSIFMIGATMARFFDPEVFKRDDVYKSVAVSLIVRLGLMAGVILAAALFLPIPDGLREVLVIQAAMPAAIFPIILARLYDGHPATAIQVALATSIVAIGTAPLVIAFGLRWLGIS